MAPEVQRRLAAILSADVVGYSRLMAEDEDATVDTITAYRERVTGLVRDHRGRVVDSPGDNILAEFPTATEAVRCAVEVQRVIGERNTALPERRRMQLRIGVHMGEVRVEGERIYGDGVNVAARLEGLAMPGGVCISRTVHEQVQRKLPLRYTDLGAQAVKNLPEPIHVYRVHPGGDAGTPPARSRSFISWIAPAAVVLAIAGAGVWLSTRKAGESGAPPNPDLALPSGPSIAVLAFANMSGDPGQDYFSDGLTEDIITGLSRFRNLFVIARNSSFQYKGRAVDIKQVGRELGVRYVIEGSVRRDAGAIRVTAQLLDATTGAHLWAETYDRDLTASSLFELQDDITTRVVATLAGSHGVISRAGQVLAREKGTDSLTAYDCVLRSYEYEALHTSVSHLRARDCLEQTVELDPSYVDAWAQLAYLYREEFLHGFNARPGSLDRALEYSRRAVELDPTNQRAHYALAFAHFGRRNFESFFAEAERAIALNPNDVRVLGGMGVHMAFAGRWDRGVALARKAQALNPNHPWAFHMTLAFAYYRNSQYEEAAIEAEKISVRSLPLIHAVLAASYGQLGREEEAGAVLAELLRVDADFPDTAREEFGKFLRSEELIGRLMDGLRKAGLKKSESTDPAQIS